jgi:DNA-binding transcriptional regulator GbsR (MarR family)
MTFKQQFSQDDILAVLDTQTPKTMTAIANEVGCVRNTVARVLKQLEEQGLVKQVHIKGSNNRAWVRVVDVYETEGVINELGCACIGSEYAGMKFKIIVYKE